MKTYTQPYVPAWEGWKQFVCTNREHECDGTDSFYFLPADFSPCPEYQAGQYVCAQVDSALHGKVSRPYTISQAPGSGMIRLTIKEAIGTDGVSEGIVSHIIHRTVKVGSTVELSAPAGGFVLDDFSAEHPLVLIAGGIGISAMLPMLEQLSTEAPLRRVHLLYVARNSANYPLRQEVKAAFAGLKNAAKGVFYTQPGEDDKIGVDYDAAGMITPDRMRSFCQDPDADFFICGPEGFTKDMAEALKSISIIEPRIHTNSFGLGI